MIKQRHLGSDGGNTNATEQFKYINKLKGYVLKSRDNIILPLCIIHDVGTCNIFIYLRIGKFIMLL
jgi:hypothetical protein